MYFSGCSFCDIQKLSEFIIGTSFKSFGDIVADRDRGSRDLISESKILHAPKNLVHCVDKILSLFPWEYIFESFDMSHNNVYREYSWYFFRSLIPPFSFLLYTLPLYTFLLFHSPFFPFSFLLYTLPLYTFLPFYFFTLPFYSTACAITSRHPIAAQTIMMRRGSKRCRT